MAVVLPVKKRPCIRLSLPSLENEAEALRRCAFLPLSISLCSDCDWITPSAHSEDTLQALEANICTHLLFYFFHLFMVNLSIGTYHFQLMSDLDKKFSSIKNEM